MSSVKGPVAFVLVKRCEHMPKPSHLAPHAQLAHLTSGDTMSAAVPVLYHFGRSGFEQQRLCEARSEAVS